MQDFVEIPGRIERTFKFRVLGEKDATERQGLRRISEVRSQPLKWLWEPYIPLGRLTLLGGDPGIGKSFISGALAAALTTGRSLPGERAPTRKPMNVVMLSVEDDPADTLRPRLEGLDADLDRIFFSTDDIILDEDGIVAVRDMAKAAEAKLLVLDPIVAFLGPKMDMNRANEVRHMMKGLARIARELDIAILIVRHNRKEMAGGGAGKAIYSGMGSIDFTASVRSELAVNEARNGQKFLNHIKTNAGRKGQSLTYSITSRSDGSAEFRWGDFAAWPPHTPAGKAIIATRFKDEDKMRRWLFDLLTQHPDGMAANDIVEHGREFGYTQTKLDRAKKGVAHSEKSGNVWLWKLDPNARGALAKQADDDVE